MNEHTLKDAFSEVTAKTSFDMEKSVKKKKSSNEQDELEFKYRHRELPDVPDDEPLDLTEGLDRGL